MNKRILYNGRAWDEDKLPPEVRARIIDVEDSAAFEDHVFSESIKTHNRLIINQNIGDRDIGEFYKDERRARNTYWRGCSPQMNTYTGIVNDTDE